jgi:DNA polymerase-4
LIVYVRVPGFYAAVEQADHPLERGRPLIVGGNPRKRGTVTGANADARQAGVREGMPVREALALCPQAVVRPTRLHRYREVGAELRAVWRSVTDRFEPDGLEAAYLEPSPREQPLRVAADLCVRVRAEAGLAAVAGVGPTRFVAFLAARHARPEGIREVPTKRALEFLAPLAVTEIWGLGPTTAERLAGAGIATIGDLQRVSAEALEQVVGRNAAGFRMLARAEDRGSVRPRRPPRSLSRERTLPEATVDLRTLEEVIVELAARLQEMLQRERRTARTLALAVRHLDDREVTRSVTRDEPFRGQNELRQAALELLARTNAAVRPVRRLRLQASRLMAHDGEVDGRQLRLF